MQLDFANKEKVALQTILEGKVLPLADELSKGLVNIREEAAHGIDPHDLQGSSDRLNQQVTTLQRLLAATVSAMARASNNARAAAARS